MIKKKIMKQKLVKAEKKMIFFKKKYWIKKKSSNSIFIKKFSVLLLAKYIKIFVYILF
jgi:hypothetical protein